MTDELLTTSNEPIDLPDDLDPTSLRRRAVAAVVAGLLMAGTSVAALPTDADARTLILTAVGAFCINAAAALGLTGYVRNRATPEPNAVVREIDAQMRGERDGMAMGRAQTVADLELLTADRPPVEAREAADTFDA